MALTYDRQTRTLHLKGVIAFADNTTKNIDTDDILSYSIQAQTGSEGLPLGTTEAASYNLSLKNVGRIYTPSMLDNAKISMQIGIERDGAFVYSDFGVWYVQSVNMPEQSVAIDIMGYDALASRFSAVYNDTAQAYPTTIGSLVTAVCAAAGVTLQSASFPNAAVSIKTLPEWPEDATLRDILGFCAACAGGFARIGRNGRLEIVSYADNASHSIDSGLYRTFTPVGGQAFSFNAIEVKFSDEDEEYTRYAVNANVEDNATNTLQIEGNPLMTGSIVNSLVSELSGISMSGASVTWGGDPAVQCGDMLSVTARDGSVTKIMVNAQTLSFDGGLSATESCNLPTLNTASSASYSTGSSVFDANGNVRATRVSGLDNSVVSATTGHFEHLTAADIAADSMTAALINALRLRAESISASDVTTDILTAATASILEATIRKLTAGTISTDSLYAAVAELITLKAQSITAGNIETDQLAAALANIVSLHVATGDFDLATVSNLLSNALILQQGVADSMMITNLSVTRANLLSAILGELVVKGSDGNYYRIVVGADGGISTEPAQVTAGEVAAGQTSGGQSIVETNLAVGDLDAQNIRAASAIVNELLVQSLNAGKITAGDALLASATIPSLYTTAIQAIGDGMDLSANDTIRLLLGAKDEMQKWFTFDNELGLLIQKPAYTDANGVEHPASIWRTITDETGYHIQRTDLPGYVASFARDRLIVDGAQIGDIVARKTASGGWAWVDA